MKTSIARSIRCAPSRAPRAARLRTILLATVAFSATASAAFAQTNTFTGGANPLNPQSGNWSSAGNWSLGTLPATNQDVIFPDTFFTGGSYAALLDIPSTPSLDSVSIAAGATLALGANTLNVNGNGSGATNTISMFRNGIDGATLTLAGGAINAPTLSFAYGETISGYGTISGAISGDGTVVADSGGTLTLSPQSFTATQIQLNGGTLDSTGLLTLGAGATLSGNGTVAANLSGSGAITASGGTLVLSGTVSSAAVNIDSGSVLQITGTVDAANAISVGGGLDVAGTLNASSGMSVGGSLTVESTGVVLGSVDVISGATLDLIGGGVVSAVLNPGSTLVLDTNANLSTGDGGATLTVLSGGNPVGTVANSGATINFSGSNAEVDYTGTGTIDNSTLSFQNAGSASIKTGAGTILTLGSGATINQTTGNAELGGSGTIIHNGTILTAGTLTIDPASFSIGNNGYIASVPGGTVIIQPGTFTNFAGGSLSGGIYDVFPGGTIRIAAGTVTQIGANASVILEGNGASFQSGSGTDITQTLTSVGPGGELTIRGDATPTFANNLAVNGGLEFAGGNTSVSGNISGSGTLFVDGGTATLSGTNTFSGQTSVTGGQLNISSVTNLGTSRVTVSGGTLDLGGARLMDGDLAAGQLTLSGGTIQNGTLSTANDFVTAFGLNSGTVRTTLSGTGSLTVAGGNNLILADNGANNYAGGTTINAGGTLKLGDGVFNGSVPGAITDDGTLILNANGTQNFTNPISGGGGVTVTGSGLAILSGNNTYAGDTTVSTGSGGRLSINSSGALGSNNQVIVNNGGVLIVQSTGVITGANGNQNELVVNAGGTLDIFGGAVIDGATLNVGANLTIDDNLTVQTDNNGATLKVVNAGQSVGQINNAGVTINLTGAGAQLQFVGDNNFDNATINIGNATTPTIYAADPGGAGATLLLNSNAVINHTAGIATLTGATSTMATGLQTAEPSMRVRPQVHCISSRTTSPTPARSLLRMATRRLFSLAPSPISLRACSPVALTTSGRTQSSSWHRTSL